MESNQKEKVSKEILDTSIGIIVFFTENDKVKFLLIKHSAGHWAFPKGHADEGETEIETALRELYEETGIKKVRLISDDILLEDRYKFSGNNGDKIHKTVHYYIAETNETDVKVDNDEIVDYKWCTLEESFTYLVYPETIDLINKAFKFIYEHRNEKKI